MITKKECVAMLLAGGQGSRLFALTQKKAKPAVPYGGKYKIIDFPLSNCANSGIDTVGVLTQYEPLELNSYIGTGGFWDLDNMNGGAFVLPPYVRGEKGIGTAELLMPFTRISISSTTMIRTTSLYCPVTRSAVWITRKCSITIRRKVLTVRSLYWKLHWKKRSVLGS